MKLTFAPYRLRLLAPVRGVSEREGFVVRIEESGRTGLGEASIVPEVGTEPLEAAREALGRAPLRLDELDALAGTPAARHAVELALLDLAAQREGVPLAKLLEARAAGSVAVSALLVERAACGLAREAAAAVAAGFRTVKLKLGADDDYVRAAVVRDSVGPSVRLRVDANAAWTAEQALRMLRTLAPLGIELCEQPTADLAGLEDSPVAIAADEQVATDLEGALARASVLVLKPMALGGVLPALRLAARARGLGKRVVVTTSLDGAIARAGAAHLAAALLAFADEPASGLATGALFATDVCADRLAPRDGRIQLSSEPGLGVA